MDIAIMRAMPNMVVMVTADVIIEVKKMISLVAEYDGLVYLCINRADTPLMFNDDHKMKIGKGIVVREGNGITLISK